MLENESDTETPRDESGKDGWSINNRGYIQGGFDTPIFLKAKQRFNSIRTQNRVREKREKKEKLLNAAIPLLVKAQIQAQNHYIQPVAIFGDPGFNRPTPHPIKEQNA